MERFEKKYYGQTAKLTFVSDDRSVGGCVQFSELFKRNLKNLFRNTGTIVSSIASPIVVASMVLSLYWNACKVDLENDQDLSKTRRATQTWIGLSFILTN